MGGQFEIGDAHDENIARGLGLHSKLRLIPKHKAEMPLQAGVFPLRPDSEGAIQDSGGHGADIAAGVCGQLVVDIASHACVHLVLVEAGGRNYTRQ